MEKIKFFYENLLKAVTPTVKNPADLSYPLSNLLHDWFTKYTRTTGVDDEWWKWNLGSAKPITGIIFKGHNFRVGATVTIQVSSTDADTWNICNEAFVIDADTLAKELVYKFWSSPQNAWRIKLSVQDAGYPATYLKLGKPWAGISFEPSMNFTNAYMNKINDLSTIQMSADGYHFGTKVLPRLKSFEYVFENLTNADRLAFIEMFEEVGVTDTFFVLQDEDALPEGLFYARNMNATWEFPHVFMDDNFSFTIPVMESK